MVHDRLARGLAATIIIVFLLGLFAHAIGFITTPQGGTALVLAATTYLFGGWIGRNGRR